MCSNCDIMSTKNSFELPKNIRAHKTDFSSPDFTEKIHEEDKAVISNILSYINSHLTPVDTETLFKMDIIRDTTDSKLIKSYFLSFKLSPNHNLKIDLKDISQIQEYAGNRFTKFDALNILVRDKSLCIEIDIPAHGFVPTVKEILVTNTVMVMNTSVNEHHRNENYSWTRFSHASEENDSRGNAKRKKI